MSGPEESGPVEGSDVQGRLPRLDALLVDWTTQGLTPPEEAELRGLLDATPATELSSLDAVQRFELAAAALHLTSSAVTVPMPASIENEIREQARRHFSPAVPLKTPEDRPVSGSVVQMPVASPKRFSFGWWAAAACLAVAVVGWWPRLSTPESPRVAEVPVSEVPVSEVPVSERPAVETPVSLEESLEERVATAPDALRLPWTVVSEDPVSEDPAASGEVIWSTTLQAGVMRFDGFEANDPSVFQYQLWIFDKEQDEKFPVDGGVFDILPGEEALVAIRAKLDITAPTLFAVTREKPGGVVVSDRERMVVLAQAG